MVCIENQSGGRTGRRSFSAEALTFKKKLKGEKAQKERKQLNGKKSDEDKLKKEMIMIPEFSSSTHVSPSPL